MDHFGAAAAVKATGEAGIPHEQAMAVLDVLDAADLAASRVRGLMGIRTTDPQVAKLVRTAGARGHC